MRGGHPWSDGNARPLVGEGNLKLGSAVTESHVWTGCSSASCSESSGMAQPVAGLAAGRSLSGKIAATCLLPLS